MTEARTGRLLAACLHQAIGEVLPQRLDFYELWLRSDHLRDGRVGPAPMAAILGFLREESDYHAVVARAGQLAAEWTVAGMGSVPRRAMARLPRALRARIVLRLAAGIVRRTSGATRASTSVRRGAARLSVEASLFCTVRAQQQTPLCGFYSAAAAELFGEFALPAQAVVERCRAVQGSPCVIVLDLTRVAAVPAVAA